MKDQTCGRMPPEIGSSEDMDRKRWAPPTLTVQPVEAITEGTFAGSIFDGSFTS